MKSAPLPDPELAELQCPSCGDMNIIRTTTTLEITAGGVDYGFEDVPAYKCENCGFTMTHKLSSHCANNYIREDERASLIWDAPVLKEALDIGLNYLVSYKDGDGRGYSGYLMEELAVGKAEDIDDEDLIAFYNLSNYTKLCDKASI